MVKFTIEQIRKVMDNADNIRNMSVIAHVDHGKSTLTDSLILKAGIISEEQAGEKRFTQIKEEEKTRGITIKSTGVSLYYEQEVGVNDVQPFLINLIDSPGHVDFSSEVTAALRVTDGALVVVDYVEGVCVQTETVFRQALQELIKPVLCINKVDRAFFEVKHDPETIYQNFCRVIENANVIISTYQKTDEMGDLQVSALNGTVAFGSAIHGWGFTLETFAYMIGKKFNMEPKKILPKLWGDNFYDSSTGKWSTDSTDKDGNELPRGFCKFILEPIMKLATAIQEGDRFSYTSLMTKLGIQISNSELDEVKTPKHLMRKIMHNWIDLADCLLVMIISHLPSPKVAQRYRTKFLYEGPMDDEVSQAMMKCDPNGPLMMFVSKMVPNKDGSRFYAFGRVFSGTVSPGMKVRILGTNYKQGRKEDCFEKNVMRVVIWMANKIEEVESIPCGNTCALVGIDQCLVKQGTITTDPSAHTIRSMKYSVSPVVRVSVRPKNPFDLPQLIEGLNRMVKTDPLVQVISTETEQVVAGCGELHLEICLKDLVKEYTNNIEIIVSEPVVPYKETVTTSSNIECVSKSANKHNRLFGKAEPLNEELTNEIDCGTLKVGDKIDSKIIERLLIDKYNWEQHDAKKLWCFGPDNCGPNVLVDQTQGVQYLNEIRDSLENIFQGVTREGVLAEENLRGVRFNILDTQVHRDNAHRGISQVGPMARRCYHACQLTAEPRFQEPIFLVEISAPIDVVNSLYQCFSQRRGVIFSEEPVIGTPLVVIKAYLPVSESFGFNEYLRSMTSGQASPQCIFDHWETINLDPLDSKSKAYNILMNIRKRKGLKMEIPIVSDYIDKL